MKPALACEVYGFKPSRGSISRRGIIPLSSLLDSPGLFARNLTDLKKTTKILSVEDPEDSASVDFYKNQHILFSDLTNQVKRIGILYKQGCLTESLKKIEEFFHSYGIDTIRIEYTNTDFEYKKISSLDFLASMDAFIKKHQSQLDVKNVYEFIESYRTDQESTPFGMDRLEDALDFEKLTNEELCAFAGEKIQAAKSPITNLCEKFHCQYLLTEEFIDWWSISGAPSMVIPLKFDVNDNHYYPIMIGTMFGEDSRLFELVETLSFH